MAPRTRRSQPLSMTPLEDLKRLAKPRRAVVAPPSSDETNRPTGHEGNKLNRKGLMKPKG